MFITEERIAYIDFTDEEVSAFEKVIEALEKISTDLDFGVIEANNNNHEVFYQEDFEKMIDDLHFIVENNNGWLMK